MWLPRAGAGGVLTAIASAAASRGRSRCDLAEVLDVPAVASSRLPASSDSASSSGRRWNVVVVVGVDQPAQAEVAGDDAPVGDALSRSPSEQMTKVAVAEPGPKRAAATPRPPPCPRRWPRPGERSGRDLDARRVVALRMTRRPAPVLPELAQVLSSKPNGEQASSRAGSARAPPTGRSGRDRPIRPACTPTRVHSTWASGAMRHAPGIHGVRRLRPVHRQARMTLIACSSGQEPASPAMEATLPSGPTRDRLFGEPKG
jgi:hypothetical protein